MYILSCFILTEPISTCTSGRRCLSACASSAYNNPHASSSFPVSPSFSVQSSPLSSSPVQKDFSSCSGHSADRCQTSIEYLLRGIYACSGMISCILLLHTNLCKSSLNHSLIHPGYLNVQLFFQLSLIRTYVCFCFSRIHLSSTSSRRFSNTISFKF